MGIPTSLWKGLVDPATGGLTGSMHGCEIPFAAFYFFPSNLFSFLSSPRTILYFSYLPKRTKPILRRVFSMGNFLFLHVSCALSRVVRPRKSLYIYYVLNRDMSPTQGQFVREIRRAKYTCGENSGFGGAKNLTLPCPCSGLHLLLPPLLLQARRLKPPPTAKTTL